MAILEVPPIAPQNQPLLDGRGGDSSLPTLMSREWWLNLSAGRTVQSAIAKAVDALQAAGASVADTLLDCVRGALVLTHVGAIPKVSAAGTLSESALKDDGTVLTLLARLFDSNKTIRSTGFQNPVAGSGIEVKYDTGANVGLLVVYDRTGAAWLPLALYGSTISLLPQGGVTTNVGSLDLTGGGVLKVAGVQVLTVRQGALPATAAAATAAGAVYNQAVAQTCVTLANATKARLDLLETYLQTHGVIT